MRISTAVIRRNILADTTKLDYSSATLSCVSAYGKVAELLIEQALFIKRPLHVLDVGCGDMHVLRALWNGNRVKKSTVISTYIGYDVYETAIPVGKNTPEVSLLQEYRDLNTDQTLPNSDFIIMLEILEHVEYSASQRLLENAYTSLGKGGKLFITTPNAEMHSKDGHHYYEYGRTEILYILHSLGFSTICYGSTMHIKDIPKSSEHTVALSIIKERFGKEFYRVIASSLFPEQSQFLQILATK